MTYGVDTKIPGLKYTGVVHCPVFEGKLKSLYKTAALAMKCVEAVVETPRMEGPFGSIGGVGVVADNAWCAPSDKEASDRVGLRSQQKLRYKSV